MNRPLLAGMLSQLSFCYCVILLILEASGASWRLSGLADLRRLPRNGLPMAVASQERTGVPVMSSFYFSVSVLGAAFQPERHNCGVAVLVNRDVFGGIAALPFRRR